jgi:hypothetical protein
VIKDNIGKQGNIGDTFPPFFFVYSARTEDLSNKVMRLVIINCII